MTGAARLRVLLDEGVPRSVGQILANDGHEVLNLEDVLLKGSADPVVCTAAEANDAVLVVSGRSRPPSRSERSA